MAERELKFKATVTGDAERALERIRQSLANVGKPQGRDYRKELPKDMKALQDSMVGVRKEVTDAFMPAMEKLPPRHHAKSAGTDWTRTLRTKAS